MSPAETRGPGHQTASYRLYHFDRDGGILRGEWIEAASDESALAEAQARKHPELCTRCELWLRQRFISEFQCAPY
jgi:hypothetical protein